MGYTMLVFSMILCVICSAAIATFVLAATLDRLILFHKQQYKLSELQISRHGNVQDYEAENARKLNCAQKVFTNRIAKSRALFICNKMKLVIKPETHAQRGTLTDD